MHTNIKAVWAEKDPDSSATLLSALGLTERVKGFMTLKLVESYYFFALMFKGICSENSLPCALKNHHSDCLPMALTMLCYPQKKTTEVHSLQLRVRQHNGPVRRTAKSPQLPLSTGTGITVLSTLLTLEPMCSTRNTGYLGYSDRRDEKWSPEKRAVPSENITDKVKIDNSTMFL